jgi:hypothetical protein
MTWTRRDTGAGISWQMKEGRFTARVWEDEELVCGEVVDDRGNAVWANQHALDGDLANRIMRSQAENVARTHRLADSARAKREPANRCPARW